MTASRESLAALERLAIVLEETHPLSPRHRASLGQDIRQLWEELTSDRENRTAEYLGAPATLSAYLRYFMPWNVYRLSTIFSGMDLCLPPDGIVLDIGSGPLTVPTALYASRPELRDLPLVFHCVDRVDRVMEAGRTIFESLCMKVEGKLPPWRFSLIRESFGAPLPVNAHLVTAANVFNEFFWKGKAPLGERALSIARSLLARTRLDGSIFVMEPGDPRSGSFVSALRTAFLSEGVNPLAPCPHSLDCPMPGLFRRLFQEEPDHGYGSSDAFADQGPEDRRGNRKLPPGARSDGKTSVVMPRRRDKYPWCHFGADTSNAPAWLSALSSEAGLPKDRAVFSYLWASRHADRSPDRHSHPPVHETGGRSSQGTSDRGLLVRVVSDPFALDSGATGQYACSGLGYTLLRDRSGKAPFQSGTLLELKSGGRPVTDEKSGAATLTY